MRIASYNVENLFDRAKAMNLETWEEGRPILDAFAKLDALLGEVNYTPDIKRNMTELVKELGLDKSDRAKFVLLRQNRGRLIRRNAAGGFDIAAAGRADWAGSLELIDEPVNERAMRNTARVMNDVNADILAVVEAESRPVLLSFNDSILRAVGGTPFEQVMVIDGNDDRGIDVGLLSRAGFPIGLIRSHVDDRDDDGERIFSRDCPEFRIETTAGTLHVLVNHLKSKGFGSPANSNRRRRKQAERVREIYDGLKSEGAELVAVVGDFNDTPDSRPLEPLLRHTDLRDVFQHPAFDDGGFPGTFGGCTAGNKIDYILLSPALFGKVKAGGVLRKGMWPGVRPKKWDVYEELTRPIEAGSDHGAVWADIDL